MTQGVSAAAGGRDVSQPCSLCIPWQPMPCCGSGTCWRPQDLVLRLHEPLRLHTLLADDQCGLLNSGLVAVGESHASGYSSCRAQSLSAAVLATRAAAKVRCQFFSLSYLPTSARGRHPFTSKTALDALRL